jgi:hypothetical protein
LMGLPAVDELLPDPQPKERSAKIAKDINAIFLNMRSPYN